MIEVIVSGICFGFLGYFGRFAYAQGLNYGELLSLRFLISALVLYFVFVLRTRSIRPAIFCISKREILNSLLLGIFGYAVFSSCFFMALNHISASLTVLLLYLYPCFVAVASHLFLGERLGIRKIAALFITTAGLLLVVGGDFYVTSSKGIFLGVLSALFYAAYILYSRATLQKTSAWASVFYIQLGAGLTLAIIHLHSISRVAQILVTAWPVLIAVAIVCTLIAMALFLSGLRKLSSTEVSILSNTEPLTGLIVAAVMMGERMLALQYAGGLLILLGLCVLALSDRGSSSR